MRGVAALLEAKDAAATRAVTTAAVMAAEPGAAAAVLMKLVAMAEVSAVTETKEGADVVDAMLEE